MDSEMTDQETQVSHKSTNTYLSVNFISSVSQNYYEIYLYIPNSLIFVLLFNYCYSNLKVTRLLIIYAFRRG